jgi:hypothetical protein
MPVTEEPEGEGRQGDALRQRWVFLAFGALIAAVVALACHDVPGFHVRDLHSDYQRYCLHVYGGTTYNDATEWLDAMLWANAPDRNWDSNPQVFFAPMGDCNDLSDEVYDTIDIFFFFDEDYADGGDPNRPQYCEQPQVVACTGFPDPSAYGSHYDATYAVVYYLTGPLQGDPTVAYSIGNHEAGHPFGLADPTPGPGTGWDHCQVLNAHGNAVWTTSIMHGPGYCPNGRVLAWPAAGDQITAAANAALD